MKLFVALILCFFLRAYSQVISLPGSSVVWNKPSSISDYTNGIDVWFSTDTISNKVDGNTLAGGDWTNVPGANAYSWSIANGNLNYKTGVSPTGKPSVRTFSSSSASWLKCATMTNTQPYYQFIVFWDRTNSASGNKGFIDAYGNGRGDLFDSSGSGSMQFYAGNQGNAGSRDTQMHILYQVVNGASSSYQYYGGSSTPVNYGTQAREQAILFNDTTQGDAPDGDIFELRIYTVDPSTHVSQIFNFLGVKYGILQ